MGDLLANVAGVSVPAVHSLFLLGGHALHHHYGRPDRDRPGHDPGGHDGEELPVDEVDQYTHAI